MTSVGPSGAGCDSSAMPLPLPVAAPDFPVSGKTVWMPHANDRHFPEANFRPLQQSRAIFAGSFLLRLSYYAKENCGKTLSVFIYGQSSAFFRLPTGCIAFDCIDVHRERRASERNGITRGEPTSLAAGRERVARRESSGFRRALSGLEDKPGQQHPKDHQGQADVKYPAVLSRGRALPRRGATFLEAIVLMRARLMIRRLLRHSRSCFLSTTARTTS